MSRAFEESNHTAKTACVRISAGFEPGRVGNHMVNCQASSKSRENKGFHAAKKNLIFFEPNTRLRRLILRMG
jgi:hypothetical protein